MKHIGLIAKLVSLFFLTPLQFLYPQLSLTTELSPIIEHCGPEAGLYICIRNDTEFPLINAPIKILFDSGLEYSRAEWNASQFQIISNVPQELVIRLSQLEPCQEVCLFIYFAYNCLDYTGERKLRTTLQNGNELIESQSSLFALSPQLELSNIEVQYDPVGNIFYRTMQLSNIGNTKISSFQINNSGRKIETIISSNVGQIANSGKSLEFKPDDFLSIGNNNSFFDPGEFLLINQIIRLDSCIKELKFEFDLELKCENKTCLYKIISTQLNLIDFSSATPRYLASHNMKYSFCDSIIINTKLYLHNLKINNVVSNAYDLSLDFGWLSNNYSGNYYNDGKIENLNLILNNQIFPLIIKGKIYPFQFNIFKSDPDGKGGLSDLDGDGEFDDLLTGDTIDFTITASVDPEAYNLDCHTNSLFPSHTYGIDIHHSNFCKDKFISKANDINRYNLNDNPTYILNRENSNGIVSFAHKYPEPGTDTLFIEFKNIDSDNFRYCNNPRIRYYIQFPSSVGYDSNQAIISSGRIMNVVLTDSSLSFESDLFQLLKIPIHVFCDSSDFRSNLVDSGECYKCRNNSFAIYQFKISSEIKCEEGNMDWIPFACLTPNSTFFRCNFVDEPNYNEHVPPMSIESFVPSRISFGHLDSTQTIRINPDIDSVDLLNVSQLDTFEIKIKLSSFCKFQKYNYSNLLLRMNYYRNANILSNNEFFPYELFGYKLLFYKSNNQLFFEKTKNMVVPYVYKDHNDYNFPISELLDDPQISQYSISEFDSVILSVNGRISKNVLFGSPNMLDLKVFLNSRVGNCSFNTIKEARFNFINSNKTYLNESLNIVNYSRNIATLIVCDSITLTKNISWRDYGGYPEIDNYRNEFRKPVKIKSLNYLIPEYFQAYPSALIRKNYYGSKGDSIINRFMKNYSIGDTLRYDNLLEWEDFDNANTNLLTYLRPKCYIDIVDSIQGFIDAIHYYNKSATEMENVSVRSSVVYQLPGLKLASYLDRLLFIKDTVSNWLFDIRTPENLHNSRFNPNNVDHYYKFDNTWLYVESKSGLNYPIQLEVNSAKGVKKIIYPEKMVIGNAWLFKLDSVRKIDKCELRLVNNNCSLDSLKIILGNSCDGYPLDINDLPKTCIKYAPTKTLMLDSRTALLEFVPKNSKSEILVHKCDSVVEEYNVKNIGLAYSFNTTLHVQVPKGVSLKNAYINYLSSSNIFRNIPVQYNNTTSEYDVLISQGLNRGFLPGFTELDSSKLVLRLVYAIDCDIENGEAIKFRISYFNLCNQLQSKEIKYSPRIYFTEDIQSNNYLIDYKILKNNSCTDSMQLRVRLLRLNSNPNIADRFTLTFDNKLFFNKNSPIQSLGIKSNFLKHLQSNESESLTFELKDQQKSGDTAVILIPLHAWCQSNCTSTSMTFSMEELKDIECSTSIGGRCAHYSVTQSLIEDSIKLFPVIDIDKVDLQFSSVSSNQTKINASIILHYGSNLQMDQKVNLKIYHDSNGDGILDPSDQLLQSISYQLQLDKATQILLLDSLLVDQNVSCPLIFALIKEDNPCLCQSDTLAINSQINNRIQDLYHVCELDSLVLDFTSLLKEGIVVNFDNTPYLQKRADNLFVFHKGQESLSAEDEVNINCTFGYSDLCKVSKVIKIVIHAIDARINLIKDISCYNSTDGTLQGLSDLNSKNLIFEWNPTKNTSPLLTNINAGTYQLTITDINGCTSTAEYEVKNKEKLELTLDSKPKFNPYHLACFGDHDASINSTYMENQGPVNFQINGSNVTTPIVNLGAGKYNVVIIDANNCTAEDSIILIAPDSIEIISNINLPLCYDSNTGSIELKLKGGVPDYKYLWEDGSNSNPRLSLGTGLYHVIINDNNNCTIIDSFEVDAAIQEQLVVNPKDTLIDFDESYVLRLDFSSFIQKVTWSPSTFLNCNDCQNPIATPKQDSKFTVLVMDANGCNYFDTLQVRLKYNPKIYFPNIFSPNGDGINDHLILYGTDQLQSINSLNIYNRWGNLVYSNQQLELQDNYPLWDGKINGKLLNPGVYVYALDVTIKNGNRIIVNGDITLVR
ncbi:MAG: gliding motility-associated C-terminal domain-containing protein [Saprospiraceae bacterium]